LRLIDVALALHAKFIGFRDPWRGSPLARVTYSSVK